MMLLVCQQIWALRKMGIASVEFKPMLADPQITIEAWI